MEKLGKCQCGDSDCREHKGSSTCENEAAHIMYRIDMEDRNGTPMCEECASDAFESGLFESDESEGQELITAIDAGSEDY